MAKSNAVPAEAPEIPRTAIRLERIEDAIVDIEIEGKTPVIPHRWSEKAIRQMAEKQQQEAGAARKRKLPKNPEEEAFQSCYWLGDQGAVPAVAFKAAMVGACRFFEGITMVLAKQLIYVEGTGADQLVPLTGKPEMREDTPRNAGGVPDLRYRYQFMPWGAILRVHYMPTMIDAESVIALADMAGRGGVGDWRPSSPKSATGTYGQFGVVTGQ